MLCMIRMPARKIPDRSEMIGERVAFCVNIKTAENRLKLTGNHSGKILPKKAGLQFRSGLPPGIF